MQNCWGGGWWGEGGWGNQGVLLKADVQMANDFSFFHKMFFLSLSKLFKTFLGIFYLTSSNSVEKTQTLVSAKTRAVRALKLLVFISYLVLALTSAVTNLPNIS